MKYFVSMHNEEVEVEVEAGEVRVGGQKVDVDLLEMDGTDLHSLLLGKRSLQVLASRQGPEGWVLHVAGRRLEAQVVDERTRAIRAMTGAAEGAGGPDSLRAPMPGLVVKVEVEEGEEVGPGQGLVIVEAMKMENELKAEGPARVAKILVEPGQAVEKEQVLMEFQELEAGDEEAQKP